jgi:hypothetical protein
MFKSVEARFALRATLVGIAALVASLQGNLPGISGDEFIQGILVAGGAALAYAGVGALVPAVEPNIGNKPEQP